MGRRLRIPSRRSLAAALVALALPLAAHAAGNGPKGFTVAASPQTQTVARGGVATYAVTVTRTGGHSDPIVFTVLGLPKGTTAAVAPNPLPGPQTAATLSVQTSATTPIDTHTFTLRGTAGKTYSSVRLRLVVGPGSGTGGFTLGATPASQTVLQGEDAAYDVTITRTGGFTGAVDLSATGLPSGTTATFTPDPASGTAAALTLATTRQTPTGSQTVTIAGASGATTASTTVALLVEPTLDFTISGDLTGVLVPGAAATALDLALTNPHAFPLAVTQITVALTGSAGCAASNFDVDQIPSARYPITVPASATRTLSQLGVAATDQPQVAMLDLATSQDACRGEALTLSYTGAGAK